MDKVQGEWADYEDLRKSESLKYSESEQCFYVARYSDVDFFLKTGNVTVDFPFRSSRQLFGKTILDSDDERHILIKKNLMPFFSRRAIEHYEDVIIKPHINSIINESVAANAEIIDYNFWISQRIPTQIIMTIFGVGLEYERYLYSRLEKVVLYLDHPSNSFEEAMEAKEDLITFLSKCRSGEIPVSKHGLLSSLDEEQYENEDEVLRTCLMLLTAGMATTIASLNSVLIYMYENLDYLRENQSNPQLLRRFVDEVIRLEPAVRETIRFAKDGFEHKEISFSKYDMLKLILASANRDEQKYENPNALNLEVKRESSCTFGKGKHGCIGADLAIAELIVFIQKFLPLTNIYNVEICENDRSEGTVIKMFRKIQLKKVR